MSDNCVGNFRSAVLNEPLLHSSATILRTPLGNVRTSPRSVSTTGTTGINGGGLPPPLPPSPYQNQTQTSSSYMTGGIGGMGYGNSGYSSPFYGLGGGLGGYGSYGGGYGGYSGYGGGYGGYRFGGGIGGSYLNPNDPENQFIQIAEESSRPAFQSIESLVAAIGNIAAMLDSTFFAITSSFRAILGVAANFGRLRGVFAQFWQTFAIFRGLTWIYKKLLYWLRISKIDPSSAIFKEAFAAATSQATVPGANGIPPLPSTHPTKGQSPWPILVFLSFIFTAPYVIMKLIGNVANTARQESRNPKTWVNPLPSQVLYDFYARNPNELTIRAGQSILIAPKEVQNTHSLLNTGWALATIDNKTSGLIPISYVQGVHQMKRQQQQQHYEQQQEQQQQQEELQQEDILEQQFEQEKEKLQKGDLEEHIAEESINTAGVSPTAIVAPLTTDTTFKKDFTPTSTSHSIAVPNSNLAAPSTSTTSNHHGSNSPLNSSRKNSASSLPVIPEVDDTGDTL